MVISEWCCDDKRNMMWLQEKEDGVIRERWWCDDKRNMMMWWQEKHDDVVRERLCDYKRKIINVMIRERWCDYKKNRMIRGCDDDKEVIWWQRER